MDEVAFVNEFKNIDWDQLLSLDNSDPDISFDCFFSKLHNIIKTHIPLKKVSKKQKKSKLWITKTIKKSIRQKKALKQYINAKSELSKQLNFEKFKLLRNKL